MRIPHGCAYGDANADGHGYGDSYGYAYGNGYPDCDGYSYADAHAHAHGDEHAVMPGAAPKPGPTFADLTKAPAASAAGAPAPSGAEGQVILNDPVQEAISHHPLHRAHVAVEESRARLQRLGIAVKGAQHVI